MHNEPIHVPEEWNDHDLLTFEQFCTLIHTRPRTVRDWRRRDTGPRWIKLEGRLYITVGEIRRFTQNSNSSRSSDRHGRPKREGSLA